MNIDSKEIQMIKLNKYAREYIEEKNNNINYEKISKQMKEFSGAEYVMFNIFDENGKDFILVGFEGNKNKINKVMDIIGYNIVGKKFKYEEGRNERFEKSIVTRIESLNELVGNALPRSVTLLIEKIFKVDYIKTVRITKDEKTIGNFTLIFSEDENRNDDEMLKLFASQVGLFIDKKKDELKTIEMKERLENIIKGTNVGTWELNVKTGESIVNKRWAEMLGYKLEEILPASREKRESLIHPDDLGKLQREFQKALNKEIEYYDIELRKRHKNGNWIWINARAKVTKWSEDGSPLVVSGALTDITEKIKYENKIINQRDYLFKIFNSMSQYVIATGLDYKIQFMNEKAIRDFGNIKGKICFKELGKDKPCQGCRLKVLENMSNGETVEYLVNAFDKDLEVRASKLENKDGSISILEVIEDITEKKERQREIEYLNLHDHLTGIYNRRFFEKEINRLDIDKNLPISIITLDVNGLKLINDTFGHSKGDQILIKIAKVMKNSVESNEIVARIGGDEFSLILPKCSENKASEIADRIKENIDKESEKGVPFSLAIGFHTKEKPEEEISEVLKKAESKMYTNKLFSEKSKKREIILTMLSTLHEKHLREEEHSIRVSQLAYELGKAIQMKGDRLNMLKTAGLLHDIGKIGIDYSIIEKTGRLTEEEYEEIKKHPEIGYRILKTSIEYEGIAKLVLFHHEKLDGTGYPKGIKGEEIPLESKIISIVDAFDAMISARPYKTKMIIKDAVDELKRCSGSQFDPVLVEVFANKVIK